MSHPPLRFDPEELLAEIGWVRSLARRLTNDAHGADDLTQDALLVALVDPEQTAASANAPQVGRTTALRRWFAAVLRNLGRTRRRSERRRREREARAAGHELAPATIELVDRAATQRQLVGALLRLPEPYRSTLLLRFYAGLTQREIAERTGAPVSTVGTRIADGLERLRRKVGGRDRWLPAGAALLRRPLHAEAASQLTGALLVTTQAKLILAAVVAVGLCTFWCHAPTAPPPGGDARVGAAATPAVIAADAPPADTRREDAATALAASPPPDDFHDVPEHRALERVHVRGQVLDLAGAPVAGVEVLRVSPAGRMADTGAVVPGRVLGRVAADGDGRFEFDGVPPFSLEVHDDRWVTVREGAVGQPTTQQVLVLAAPRIPLGGAVVDRAGAPLAGVRVTVHADVVHAGLDLSTSSMVCPETVTDEQGGFRFAAAGAIAEAELQFRAPGFAYQTLPVPPGGDPALYVVLAKMSPSAHTITGRVVLEDGAPAVGALVSTGVMASRVDEHGAFAIDFEPWLRHRVDEDAPTVVAAVHPGLLPAVRTLPSVREARTSGWPRDLVLHLVGNPRTIRGVVVDETGAPLADVLVEPADLTPFGIVAEAGMPGFFGAPKSLEQLAGGGAAYTAADGTFELGGLLARRYSLCALQQPSLLSAATPPVEAGSTDVLIALDRGGLGTLRGRIVGSDGAGVAGVRVAVSQRRLTELVVGSAAVTAADGTFALDGVTRTPAFLRLEGESIVPELFRRLAANADPARLELTVGRRRRVQFDWRGWSGRDDTVQVVDAREQPLTMMLLQGNSLGEHESVAFLDGVTDTLVVADTAAFAVVRRAGAEVARVRLDLATDVLHVVRL